MARDLILRSGVNGRDWTSSGPLKKPEGELIMEIWTITKWYCLSATWNSFASICLKYYDSIARMNFVVTAVEPDWLSPDWKNAGPADCTLRLYLSLGHFTRSGQQLSQTSVVSNSHWDSTQLI
jgi:hypothetical protein